MAENLQDEILVFEDCKEYDISYPVIVTRWEIKQVHGLNKQYLQVYFQKLDNTVKAFQMNIACYSAFGREVEKLSDITIQEVDKKGIEFSEVIPLNTDTRKVEIFMCQCLLVDGTIMEKQGRQMVLDTFKPFAEEDKAAAKRLLSSAVGYPIDNVSHWYCACGKLNAKERKECITCKAVKDDTFRRITKENIQKEKEQIQIELAEQSKQRKKRNKLLAIISGVVAAVCILIGILVGTLTPFDEITVNGISYRKGNKGYTVTGYSRSTSEVVIPAKIRGVPVTSIGYDAFGMAYNSPFEITSVSIPDSVTSIEGNAFGGCSGLTSLVFPNSIMSIGNSAFSGCNNLKEIFYKGTVEAWNSISLADGNILLTSAKMYFYSESQPLSSGNYWRYREDGSIEKIFATTLGLTYEKVGGKEEYQVTGVGTATDKDIIIPSIYQNLPVTSIAENAFKEVKGLTTITIPDSVKSIGDKAFQGCIELTDIVIPNGVTTIGSYTFSDCGKLTSISIPNSVKTIEKYAFSGCGKLKNITIPEGVITIESQVFYRCTQLTNLSIPNSVMNFGNQDEFYWCDNLIFNTYDNAYYIGSKTNPYLILVKAKSDSITSCRINNQTRFILGGAFNLCFELKDITIPNTVTMIGERAFAYCRLTSILVTDGNPNYHSDGNCIIETKNKTLVTGCKNSIIPSDGSVTSIGNSAFQGCSLLTSITIPNSVTSIGDSAFLGCSGLKSIIIPNTVTMIGERAFAYCRLTSILVADGNPNYHSDGNCIIETKNKTLVTGCKNSIIPSDGSVTSIGNSAFYGCDLTNLTIPNGITSIGKSAFSACTNLTSVIIPNTVTSINSNAFYLCSGLTSIVIPNSVKSVGYNVFGGCKKLTIFAEANSNPSGWDSKWNPDNCPVVWGYKG